MVAKIKGYSDKTRICESTLYSIITISKKENSAAKNSAGISMPFFTNSEK